MRIARALLTAFLLIGLATIGKAAPGGAPGGTLDVAPQDLMRKGIPPSHMLMDVCNADGSTLLATVRETDPQLIAKGQVFQLYIFHFNVADKSFTSDSMWLPTDRFENIAMTPDAKTALIVADAGTQLISVDLVKKSARVVFKNQKGADGFRVMPSVLWYQDGKFVMPGYRYDKTQMTTGDWLGSVDPAGNGISAIHNVRDIRRLKVTYDNFAFCEWNNANQVYFGAKRPDHFIHLMACIGDSDTEIDKAQAFGGMAVGNDRVIYAARYDKEKYGVVVQDIVQKKRWELGDGKTPYNYLYMSKDGKTVLMTYLDPKAKTMTTYFAREGENWALHPVPGIDHAHPGTIRFSSTGEAIFFYNNDGLHLIRLPKG